MFWAGLPPSVTPYIILNQTIKYTPPCCTSPFLHVRHTHTYWPTLISLTLSTALYPLGGAMVIGSCMYLLYFQCTLCMFFPYGGETLPALGNLTAPSLFWAGHLFSRPYSPRPRRWEKFPRAARSRGPFLGLSLAAVRVPRLGPQIRSHLASVNSCSTPRPCFVSCYNCGHCQLVSCLKLVSTKSVAYVQTVS